MNRALIERTLAAMNKGYMGRNNAEYKAVMEALKAELEKPAPEPEAPYGLEPWEVSTPVATMIYPPHSPKHPFLALGDCASLYQDASKTVPLYAAPTKPNCKWPTCHSQEYQDKLVQEILDEPIGWATVAQLKRGAFIVGAKPSYMDNLIPLYTKGTQNV